MVLRPGDRQLIKEWNIALVLDTIRRHEPTTRVEIADRTRLGRSTVTVIINRLMREGLVEEIGSAGTTDLGRKPTLLRLGARALHVIGVKVAPGGVTGSVLDLHAQPIEFATCQLSAGPEPAELVAAVGDVVREALDRAKVDPQQVIGAGVVMPGVVDNHTGAAVSGYFPACAGVPLRELLEAELQLPVLTDNDANAFTLAERWYGAGRGADTLLCLTVGVGIGAGLIIDGRLHRGFNSGAGEIGHTCMEPDGPLCKCGRRGCLEALAGDAGTVRAAREALERQESSAIWPLAGAPENITREVVVQAARAGDQLALRLLSRASAYLGVAVANAINLISPARIVVGGEAVAQAGDLILEPMRTALRKHVFGPLADGVDVVPAALGADAWVRGAAILVLEEAFRVPVHRDDQESLALPGRIGAGKGR